MKRTIPALAALFACMVLVGCGSQESPPPSRAAVNNAPASIPANAETVSAERSPARPGPQDSSADAVVSAFLEALRKGDEVTAEQLLTTKAREEIAKRDLAVQPPGTPSATYKIGEVEYVDASKSGAHVKSVWTEHGTDGTPVSYEVIWALRRQSAGWRVAGLATLITEDQPPVFFNFEEPDDMLRKWKQADAELAAEGDKTIRQARQTQPEPSTSSR